MVCWLWVEKSCRPTPKFTGKIAVAKRRQIFPVQRLVSPMVAASHAQVLRVTVHCYMPCLRLMLLLPCKNRCDAE